MATSIYAKPIKAKTILKFTLPTVLMMVFMSLYTVVDGIVVATVSYTHLTLPTT